MEIIRDPGDVRSAVHRLRARHELPIGFVPTMGALHEGHLSLIRTIRREGYLPIVSIFVNPIQFGPGEDFERYPRPFAQDCALLEAEGVACLFAPTAERMYRADHTVFVEEAQITRGLCGARRPGHFRGVATVVLKLFHLIGPDAAAFGRKDAQQARLIEKMIEDLNLPIRLLICPIVRESDGLAMSSRNRYLGPEARRQALCLIEGLRQAKTAYEQGERQADRLRAMVVDAIARQPLARLDYAEVVDWKTMQPVSAMGPATLLAVAAWVDQTRLIDNLWITPDGVPVL